MQLNLRQSEVVLKLIQLADYTINGFINSSYFLSQNTSLMYHYNRVRLSSR